MAHNNTVLAQVLKLVPRHEFESLARKHKSGRMARSMTRWGQFVAMGMAQLTGRCSLRDIVSNLAVQSCKLTAVPLSAYGNGLGTLCAGMIGIVKRPIKHRRNQARGSQ